MMTSSSSRWGTGTGCWATWRSATHARPLPPRAQQLAMTAVALLTLESVHAERLRLAGRAPDGMVVDLLRAGMVTAARHAAAFAGVELPGRCRVALVAAADPGALLAAVDGSPGSRDDIILVDLGGSGQAPLDSPELRAWAARRLAPLAGSGNADLAETLAAALRCRSEQEAARELAVHRHTVSNRVARIESVLGVSLGDPDARAELWLALRLAGPLLAAPGGRSASLPDMPVSAAYKPISVTSGGICASVN